MTKRAKYTFWLLGAVRAVFLVRPCLFFSKSIPMLQIHTHVSNVVVHAQTTLEWLR